MQGGTVLMDTWIDTLKNYPLSRLQSSNNAEIRYLTLTDLLDIPPDDPEAVRERNAVAGSAEVAAIRSAMNAGGYWGSPGDSIKRFSGTLWQLMILLELGCSPDMPELRRAASYLLDLNFDDTKKYLVSWKGTPQSPCYQAQILWTALAYGLAGDPRVASVISWIRDNVEFHDGDDQVPDPDDRCLGRHTCIRAAVPLVQALAAVPLELRDKKLSALLRAGTEFLLVHHVYKRSHNQAKPISPYMTRLTFPGFYYPDALQILYLLTGGGIFDARMADAIETVRKKQGSDGMWTLGREYNERKPGDTFPVIAGFGEKGAENEWITLRALITLKRWYERKEQSAHMSCFTVASVLL